MTQIHASAIAIDDQGVLLRGPSGAGKSDLALRLIEQGATLISDDRVEVMKKGNDLIAFPPPTIAGFLEVRHLGIIKMQHVGAIPVRLIVDLLPLEKLERMPQADTDTLENITLPRVAIYPFEPSAAAKVSLALAIKLGHIERIE